jgi:diketogulonate reductase-like aldo/keto reductase
MEHVTADDAEIPALGFGTARMTGEECRSAVADALELGYRHLDTAQMYDNEDAVGAAVRESDVPRDEVFLVTKLHPSNLAPRDVHSSFDASLDRLDTDYVDLLLIHAPRGSVPISETIGAMNDLQGEGTVRHVGVSNFSVSQLREAMDASATPVVTNQVEYHLGVNCDELLGFCRERDVALTAYSPLDVGDLSDDEELRDIGDRHGKTPAQVALRWLVQQENVVAIPKAASAEHRAENLDVFDFELTDAEMGELSDRGARR